MADPSEVQLEMEDVAAELPNSGNPLLDKSRSEIRRLSFFKPILTQISGGSEDQVALDKLSRKYGENGILPINSVAEIIKDFRSYEKALLAGDEMDAATAAEMHHTMVEEFVAKWESEFVPSLDLIEGPNNVELRKRILGCSNDETKTGCDEFNSYTFDYCLVFKIGEKDKEISVQYRAEDPEEKEVKKAKENHYDVFSRRTAYVIGALKAAGLRVFCYLSTQKDEIYCMIGADEDRLRTIAGKTGFTCRLKGDKVRSIGKKYGLALAVQDNDISEDVWETLYGRYRKFHDDRAEIYQTYSDGPYHQNSIFDSVARLKLTTMIVESEYAYGGANLPISRFKLHKDHPLLAFYPLHDETKRHDLELEVSKLKSAFYPPDSIRDYYGEYIAMYFEFLSFYTWFLIIPALMGIPIFILQIDATLNGGNVDPIALTVFGFAVIIWSTCFLEAWKRHQSSVAMKWGMHNFASEESSRPEFDGEWTISDITGESFEYFPETTYLTRIIRSQLLVLTMIGCVFGMVFALMVFRGFLMKGGSLGLGPQLVLILTAALNAVQITVSNVIYTLVSKALNDWENHRTQTDWENSLINKTFYFKLVNSYFSLFYISFLKANDDGVFYCKNSWAYTFKRVPTDIINSTFGLQTEAEAYFKHVNKTLHSHLDKLPSEERFTEFMRDCCDFAQSGGKLDIDPDYVNPNSESYEASFASYVNANGGASNFTSFACCQDNSTWANKADFETANKAIQDVLLVHSKGWDFRGECLQELFIQLGTIFGLALILNNFIEIFVPWLMGFLSRRREGHSMKPDGLKKLGLSEGDQPETSAAEVQFTLQSYEGTFFDYDELTVQFGYVVLFVMSFPMAPLLAFLNNVVEFQVDGTKIIAFCRRPVPRGACNMGAWENKFEVISWICIVTNVGLIFFTADIFPSDDPTRAIWLFLGMEHVLFVVKLMVSFFIPDAPVKVHDQKERSNYISSILIET